MMKLNIENANLTYLEDIEYIPQLHEDHSSLTKIPEDTIHTEYHQHLLLICKCRADNMKLCTFLVVDTRFLEDTDNN